MSERALSKLLALYKPNVQRGNFQADVAQRGGNRMLASAITTLGLATEAEVAEEFKRRDREHAEEWETYLERVNAEKDTRK